ncbi:MAG TPA: Ig-like domain-containing protein [Gemmatimonadales bacterium]|nr:Ig-like domain-containing protein [Gemmatimonadales bacterium]
MIRLADSKASVFTCAIVLLSASLSACSDSTSLASPEGGYDVVAESTLRRGSTGGGPAWKQDVTSVDVTPNSFSLAVGATAQLSVASRNRIGKPVDGVTIRWISSDTAVATVVDGVVRARTAGLASLIATVNGLSDTAHATVTAAEMPVASVEITPDSANLVVGESLTLTAHGLAADSTELAGRAITWSSSNSTVASVTSAGKVTGLAPGSVTVIATSEGKSAPATVVVSTAPLVAVDSVLLSPSTVQVEKGDSTRLSVTLRDADGTVLADRSVTWTSGDDGVAKVSSTGVVKGVASGTTTVMATSEGQSDAAQIQVVAQGGVVTSVSVTPAAATVTAGESVQLAATAKDGLGQAVSGTTVAWASSNTSVASVSSSGEVRGVAAGTASVTATVDGVRGTSTVTVESAASTTPPAEKVGYFVAPNGSSGNSGSISNPWDLASVLRGGKNISPGDTVWVRGGTYRGAFVNYLNGNSSQQVVIRQYPGERATIDGYLVVLGSYVTFQGLEVMSSNPLGTYRIGVDVKAPGARLVNLVVHDAGASGVGLWNEAPNAELYGSIIYNNGTNNNQDHGVYFNGNSGTKYLTDNIVFNNWTYGFHGYSSISGEVRNLRLDGNVAFNNGSVGANGTAPDIFVGGSQASNISVTDNMGWRRDDGELVLRLADGSSGNSGLTLTGNYTVGRTLIGTWSGMIQSGNTFLSSSNPPTSGQRVFVRPNKYEDGRANIIVYNWSNAGAASADVSSVLRPGDEYEVRAAQNFYAPPVARGTYGGGSISLPMSTVQPASLIGRSGRDPGTTGSTFHVFVLLKTN